MKLQFKHQKFQADAAKSVVDVFAGQPYLTPSYMMDKGDEGNLTSGEEFSQTSVTEEEDFTGWSNHKIVPELSDRLILDIMVGVSLLSLCQVLLFVKVYISLLR